LKLSNDVWKYNRIRGAVKKRKSLGEETKQRIFLLISESEPKGMTTDELAKATGRNRQTIHGICREFQKK
jgi:DNA invertase Pin-like site-specific DNA recombinase